MKTKKRTEQIYFVVNVIYWRIFIFRFFICWDIIIYGIIIREIIIGKKSNTVKIEINRINFDLQLVRNEWAVYILSYPVMCLNNIKKKKYE